MQISAPCRFSRLPRTLYELLISLQEIKASCQAFVSAKAQVDAQKSTKRAQVSVHCMHYMQVSSRIFVNNNIIFFSVRLSLCQEQRKQQNLVWFSTTVQ